MPMYENKKNVICPECGHNVFYEKNVFVINEENINSTLTSKKVYKRNNVGKEVRCNNCNAILLNVDYEE